MAAESVTVRLPAEVDLNSAAEVGQELARAARSGARIVIADLSATTFCDTTAVRMLLTATQDAAASGVQLRLVIADGGPVRRVIDLLGLGGMLRSHPANPAGE